MQKKCNYGYCVDGVLRWRGIELYCEVCNNGVKCEECDGSGKVHSHNDECWECDGRGWIIGEQDEV
jgi:DnaJ-class molecular chaperone